MTMNDLPFNILQFSGPFHSAAQPLRESPSERKMFCDDAHFSGQHKSGVRTFLSVFQILFMMAIGTLSLRAQDVRPPGVMTWKENNIALSGPWQYYPFALLKHGDRFPRAENVFLPHLWVSSGQARGFATYRTHVVIPPGKEFQKMALIMPDVYSSYHLWIDGVSRATNGTVATEPSRELPQWKPQTVTFIPATDTIEIIIQVSNFHHHLGGIGKPVVLGKESHIMHTTANSRKLSELLLAGLLLIALINVLLYLGYWHKAFFLFSLLTLLWALRSVFSNDYTGVYYFPEIPWAWVVRLEYLSIYLTTLIGLMLITTLFPLDFSITFRRFYIVAGLFFVLVTTLTEPLFFTRYVNVYLAFSASVVLATLSVAIKAFIYDRQGSGLLITAILLGVVLFGYVILSYENILEFNELIFNLGFLSLFILAAMGIHNHFVAVSRKEKSGPGKAHNKIYDTRLS